MATTHVLARSSRSSLCVDLLHQASALRMHPRLGQPLVARSQQRLAQRANGAKRPPREAAPERFLLCVCYNLARGPCTLTTRTSGPARCAACAALHCSVCRLTCRRVSFSDADSCTACWAHQGCACCFPVPPCRARTRDCPPGGARLIGQYLSGNCSLVLGMLYTVQSR